MNKEKNKKKNKKDNKKQDRKQTDNEINRIIDKEWIKKIFELYNIKELRPAQKKALLNGLLDKKNLIITTPTASGKTLIAVLAMFNSVLKNNKALYIAPLRSLCSEKYKEFKKIGDLFNKRITIATSDYDEEPSKYRFADIIIFTTEKLDSVLRHNPEWLNEVKCVVFDEFHLLNDIRRGPVLEFVITHLKTSLSAQFIYLSATIKNKDELSEWLNAEIIESSWRPVKLYHYIFLDDDLYFKYQSK